MDLVYSVFSLMQEFDRAFGGLGKVNYYVHMREGGGGGGTREGVIGYVTPSLDICTLKKWGCNEQK